MILITPFYNYAKKQFQIPSISPKIHMDVLVHESEKKITRTPLRRRHTVHEERRTVLRKEFETKKQQTAGDEDIITVRQGRDANDADILMR